MAENKIFEMKFEKLYPLYTAKAEKKGRTVQEVNEIMCWLTGYSQEDLLIKVSSDINVGDFFKTAPAPHPNRTLITGSVCGVKISEIDDPLMKEMRYLDKLIDELAKGKSMDKILR